MKSILSIAALLSAGTFLAHAADVGTEVVLPEESELTFKYDYSSNSDTPTVNNGNWSWGHYGSEVPTIVDGVAHFSSGGPYTNSEVLFNVDEFTVAFDISEVTNTNDGAVLVFGQRAVATYFYVTASTTSVKLFSGSSAIVTFDVDLAGATAKNIVISNSQSGSLIAVNGVIVAESEAYITGGELSQYFNVGAQFHGGMNKVAGTLDNVALYGAAASAIPEPSAFGLLAGLGALALAGTRRRKRA